MLRLLSAAGDEAAVRRSEQARQNAWRRLKGTSPWIKLGLGFRVRVGVAT
jgi:hypothetical protein